MAPSAREYRKAKSSSFIIKNANGVESAILSRDWQYQSVLLFRYWYFFPLVILVARSLVAIHQQRARACVLSILKYNMKRCIRGISILKSSREGGVDATGSIRIGLGKLKRAATM